MKKYPLIIGNEEVFTEDTHIVYNKYTGEPYAQISLGRAGAGGGRCLRCV